MTSPKRPYILTVFVTLLSIATALSFYFIKDRIRMEKANASVEICVDAADVRKLCLHDNAEMTGVLRKMKEAGARSVAVSEMTLSDALFSGVVGIEKIRGGMALKADDGRLYHSLLHMLPARYGIRVNGREKYSGGYRVVIPNAEDLKQEAWNAGSPLGYDPELIDAAGNAGMSVYLRPGNVRDASWLSGPDADGYLFDDKEVPGFPGNESIVGQAIVKTGRKGVFFEFSRPLGMKQLVNSMSGALVNGHTITPRELETRPDQKNTIGRWRRAVKERSVRFLLVRAIPGKGIEDNIFYLKQVAESVAKDGYRMGSVAIPPYPFSSHVPLRMAVIALTALTVPLGAMALGVTSQKPFQGYLIVNAAALCGGCVLSACFFDFRFMQRIIIMPGIKLFLFLPLVIAAAYAYRGTRPGEIMKKPLTTGHALLFGFAVAAAYVFISRSGNGAAGWLSPETSIREWLEAVLPARPRTKEFLIAQPLLYAGLAFRKKILLVAGSLAPVSILNTFFHAHTPFILSLERTLIGMVMGMVLGYLLVETIKFTGIKIKGEELRNAPGGMP